MLITGIEGVNPELFVNGPILWLFPSGPPSGPPRGLLLVAPKGLTFEGILGTSKGPVCFVFPPRGFPPKGFDFLTPESNIGRLGRFDFFCFFCS